MSYMHLVNFLNEYLRKVTKTLDEAVKLVEACFEYIAEMNE